MSYYSIDFPTSERPLEIELIRSMARGDINEHQAADIKRRYKEATQVNTDDAFISKSASDWAKPPKAEMCYDQLFGDFWYKGELCIMFADTNVGKSVLAVQIGDSISQGHMIDGYATTKQEEPVLYFDFELSANQFAKRYSSPGHGSHVFANNFHRLVINPDANRERKFASFHDYIINAFENVLVTTKARTLIIDNITCLRTSTESAAGAVKLMQSLKMIRDKYRLSMLVLAHTPKRNPARPITRNDLQGSKMLLNFADSAFAMGESHTQPGVRYLKQIKQRTGELMHHANNVALCRLIKPFSMLKFTIFDWGKEADHLLSYTEINQKAVESRVIQLHTTGRSVRQIASETGLSNSTVFRLLKKKTERKPSS